VGSCLAAWCRSGSAPSGVAVLRGFQAASWLLGIELVGVVDDGILRRREGLQGILWQRPSRRRCSAADQQFQGMNDLSSGLPITSRSGCVPATTWTHEAQVPQGPCFFRPRLQSMAWASSERPFACHSGRPQTGSYWPAALGQRRRNCSTTSSFRNTCQDIGGVASGQWEETMQYERGTTNGNVYWPRPLVVHTANLGVGIAKKAWIVYFRPGFSQGMEAGR